MQTVANVLGSLTQYYREIGCRIKTSKAEKDEKSKKRKEKRKAARSKSAELRLPLEFPKQRVMASKRR